MLVSFGCFLTLSKIIMHAHILFSPQDLKKNLRQRQQELLAGTQDGQDPCKIEESKVCLLGNIILAIILENSFWQA